MRHSLSQMYSIWVDLEAPKKLPYIQAWERELGVKFSETQKTKIFNFVHKASLATRYQEGGYKILTRWYKTPVVLKRIFPETSDRCWRCGEEEGTMLHVFWTCPKLKDFWKMVRDTIKDVLDIELGVNPATYLLLDLPMAMTKFKKSLLRHFLTAARACVPILWKSTSSPTRQQWIGRISEIQQMEKLTAGIREQEDSYRSVWSPYISYREGALRG